MTIRILLLTLMLSLSAFAQVPPIEPGVSQGLAKWRSARYSDVRYKLNLTLEKMSPVLTGTMEVRVKVGTRTPSSASGVTEIVPIILDWRKINGFEDRSTVSNIFVNGRPVSVASGGSHADEGVRVPTDHLVFTDGVVMGENVIKLDFTSPILPSGSAITRYVDKEDGSEYLYSLFVPSDASTAFPVFDQPDLKGRFELTTYIPMKDGGLNWKVISNSPLKSRTVGNRFGLHNPRFGDPEHDGARPWVKSEFHETKPISTYVFAFAAGPFEKVEDPAPRSVPPAVAGGSPRRVETSSTPSNSTDRSQEGRFTPAPESTHGSGGKPAFLTEMGNGDAVKVEESNNRVQPPATAGGADVGGAIYVRKSQAAKFKPHADEVFRLNREAVKYFEGYFDYKFPFPKYDLVLIPEFPFGGMEHAGATFLWESAVIFSQEPTKNDHISRATLIFHEAAHQWFGDTVTMRWFDDLWLKEGFATFTAYKALEKIMPEMNAWKVFYERIKQGAYATDSTKGTTPIYQEIKNLSAAKSAYGNIVYNKAPAFLRQAEFYLGDDKFQTAVRAFLKKHEFGNAGWEDLLSELVEVGWKNSMGERLPADGNVSKEAEIYFRTQLRRDLEAWIKQRGMPIIRTTVSTHQIWDSSVRSVNPGVFDGRRSQRSILGEDVSWTHKFKIMGSFSNDVRRSLDASVFFDEGWYDGRPVHIFFTDGEPENGSRPLFVFPNYQDYGYGIFLLDDKSREYVLKNIQNEKDPFLRSMMWGALWDSVREGEIDPREFVELVVKVLQKPARTGAPAAASASGVAEQGLNGQVGSKALADAQASASEDESTTALLLNRVGTAMNYYIEDGNLSGSEGASSPANKNTLPTGRVSASVEEMLIGGMQNSPTLGQRITYYRAFLNIASSEKARNVLKVMLKGGNLSGSEGVSSPSSKNTLPTGRVSALAAIPLKTKDKFDIVTRLLILGDPDAPRLLAELEKTETGDDAKRYAYAAKAGIPTAENKAKYWNDFVNNKEISESWIEAAFGPWNSIRHSELTLPYLQKALQELPNHKRNRKIFFVNGWLGAFIGGQRSEESLAIVNKFLADNPNHDNDLRLKILENVDVIERAVKIRERGRPRLQ